MVGVFVARAMDSVRLLGQAIVLMWQAGAALLVGIVAFMVLQTLVAPVQLVAIRGAVNAAVSRERLGLWLLVLIGSLSLDRLLMPLSALLQAHLSDRFTRRVRSQLLGSINSWPGTTRFEDPDTLDDLAFVTGRLNWAGPDALLRLLQVVGHVVTMVSALALLGTISPWLAVLALVAQLPSVVTQWQFQNHTGSSLYVLTDRARRLRYLREVATAVNEAKDLRLRGVFSFLHHRYGEIYDEVDGELRGVERRLGGARLAADLFRGVLVVAAVGWLVRMLAAGSASVGEFAMALAALGMLGDAITRFAFNLGFLPMALRVIPITLRLLRMEPDLPLAPNGRTEVPAGPMEIRLEDVTFTYPGRDEPTLAGVSLVVPAGESLALVGHNGSGKTTLVKLVLRFHDVDSGRVLVDGTDVRDWDLAALRHATGALFQDFARWELSVGENIGLGDVDRLDDDEAVEAAAVAGNAADFIAELPEGYQTRLGNLLGGRQLSGGQWQRLALARATMSRAKLLVLDEPTAELDPRAEAEVFDRYAALAAERTIVLVSHRFSTVRMADRIVVLDQGRVREAGAHDELMALDGEYARLYRLQASQYVDLEAQGNQP